MVHASAAAIYVDLDGWCAGVVAAHATRVPCALWSALPDLSGIAPTAEVRDQTLVVGGHELRVGRVVDPRVRGLAPSGHGAAGPHLPGLDGLDLPASGHLDLVHVDALVGRGPGLTPLGDDVLAGWLATRAALGHPHSAVADAVRHRAAATTLLSATLLDCAARGEALPQLAQWLAAPTATTERALLAVGATSGAGLLAGARLALTSLTTELTPEHPGRAA